MPKIKEKTLQDEINDFLDEMPNDSMGG